MLKYFDCLVDLVDGEAYTVLLNRLRSHEFYSLVPNDDNRGEDGKKLREMFVDSDNVDVSSCPDGVCTVLEMLIGLAIRMENEVSGNRDGQKAGFYFWLLIKHLGLDGYDNRAALTVECLDVIDKKVRVWLERKYHRSGRGGLFPLVNTKKDQRKVEIWYQMCEYLQENYEF